jgi:glycosyltransferase involved in cell wall biosynthesis
MEKIKVSVIVPCYKVSRFLPRCLESLSHQTLDSVQIIAVDDGSPENESEILSLWQEKIPLLEICRKENGGLSDARNYGLARAKGEYVAFLDGDDYMDPNLLSSLYKKAKETDADVVACPILYEWERKTKRVSSGFPAYGEKDEVRKAFLQFYPAVWNKLYKRSLFEENGLNFQKGVHFEDVELSHRLLVFANKIAAVEDAAVHYVQREGSITAKADERLFDYIKNLNSILSFFRERKLFDLWEKELEYVCCRYLLATFLKRAAGLPISLHKKAVSESLLFLKENFPRWRNNPYFGKFGAKGLFLRFFTPAFSFFFRGFYKV